MYEQRKCSNVRKDASARPMHMYAISLMCLGITDERAKPTQSISPFAALVNNAIATVSNVGECSLP